VAQVETKVIDLHLYCCMLDQKWTINVSGETVEKVPKQILG
jgi:hypothetical protein